MCKTFILDSKEAKNSTTHNRGLFFLTHPVYINPKNAIIAMKYCKSNASTYILMIQSFAVEIKGYHGKEL